MAYVQTQRGKIYKCIVLDLDNTLWGGVIGEVGPLGVKLGHEYPGNAFREFQRTILDFYNRGIILAINSRNNPGDVDEVFEKNKNMVLKKSHFASIVANWNNKAENLKIIAKELNIGLDSLVFIDDDAMNRDLVKTELPQVFVPDWNIPPEEYVKRLLDIEAFHSMGLTEEDKERGKMYAAERERKEIVSDSSNLGSYLKTLEVEIDVHLNNSNQIPRLSQLTQKTNQFNLTTERLTESDVTKKIKNGAMFFSGDVKDKFGPYGITVLAIIEKDKKNYKLSNFLMSCRVMGRRVEEAFMSSILKELSKKKINELDAKFIVSPKNSPASSFLKDIGGKEIKNSKKETTYKIGTNQKPIKIPIKINKLF
jgi:FkbH-like protein